ncbi:hypothetical protein ACQEU3_25310 [Spirillospora sp. CA-253888]
MPAVPDHVRRQRLVALALLALAALVVLGLAAAAALTFEPVAELLSAAGTPHPATTKESHV